MVAPYYDSGGIQLWHGRCEDVLPMLDAASVDLILTDPPYGMKWDGKVSAGRNGHSPGMKSSNYGVTIIGDDEPFDPSPWLGFPRVILWGSNHYSNRLPVGSTLIWIKRLDDAFGSFLSDAEVAWMKGGHGVYCRRDQSLMGETRNRLHPTQKPVALMRWCIQKAKIPPGSTILDPYMGSGPVLEAAKQLGYKAIGIDVVERYCEIAARRLSQEVLALW